MIDLDQVVLRRSEEQLQAWRPDARRTTCACCGRPIQQPTGKGRPRVICGRQACFVARYRHRIASLGTEPGHGRLAAQRPVSTTVRGGFTHHTKQEG